MSGLELDHVLIAVTDLDEAAAELEARHGLASTVGGRHPGWGTANRIVPLGDTYLELVAVVDESEVGGSAFGPWVAAGAGPGLGRPLGWAVRTTNLDELAGRLGLTVIAGSRAHPDGGTVRWRAAGGEQAVAEPAFPFFLEWAAGTVLPGRAPAAHRAGAVALTGLRLTGDAARLAHWLGRHELPLSVAPGPPAVAAVVLRCDAGEIVL